MSNKPKPLKVFGRTHYACTRCKLSKIKCLGEKPACANCKSVHKEDYCQYPTRDRKIMIMELDLNKLQARVEHLEGLIRAQGPATAQLSRLRSNFTVQRRAKLLAQDAYLLSDTDNEQIPYRLLLLCADQLPDEAYAWRLLDLVCKTYSSEFYLVDADTLAPLVSQIYHFFRTTDLQNVDSVEVLQVVAPLALCHMFVMLAFGEQLYNNTLERLPRSIAEVTGGAPKVPGLEYYTTATKLFNLAHEEIDVQFIQNAVLLGLFACNLNRYNTVTNFFSVALQSAVAKGYHRQMETPSNLSPEQLRNYRVFEEKTKRLWWSIWVVDTVWHAKMNTPVPIDYTDTDVALPNESPILDLKDGFDTAILHSNVQLVKYMGKFNSLIYGPNIRTFSMNYINTEQFNQSVLLKNILESLNVMLFEFEPSILLPYKNISIVLLTNRNLANLCLRYNQLVILVVAPLISIVFKKSTAANIQDNQLVVKAISTAVLAAARTVKILMKIYEHNKLFVLGFWDSQHLFNAILVLIAAAIAGNSAIAFEIHRAVALFRYMADNDNINARNGLEKLDQMKMLLDSVPELSIKLDLSADITRFVVKRTPPLGGTAGLDDFFNPFEDGIFDELDISRDVSNMQGLLYDIFGFSDFSKQSQATLTAMATTIQNWDTFRGLPIHISGTGRAEHQQLAGMGKHNPGSGKEFCINNLI